MGIFLNRGIQEFEQVLNSQVYVDKTDMVSFFIEKINTEQRYICVSRPRRFGKSITANMIASYFEKGSNSAALFEGRKLSRMVQGTETKELMTEEELSEVKEIQEEFVPFDWKKEMNRYNVIRIDLADIRAEQGTPERTLDFINEYILKELEEAFHLTFDRDKAGVATALANINEKKNEKFIIIIDEWDCFFRDEKSNYQVLDRYIDLLRGLFKGNRSKNFLALAYITGILPIKKYNSESALNNFYEYTMVSPEKLAKYVGFSDKEVQGLCQKYKLDYEKMQEWYDGYSFLRAQHVYGPNSVVRAVLSGEYKSYWSQTASFNSLTSYINSNFEGLKDTIIQLIGGNRQKAKVYGYQNDMTSFKNKDDILAVLVHLGYLAYDGEKQEVYIPNREVRFAFERAIEETGWDSLVRMIDDSEELLRATIEMEEDEVVEAIENCHEDNISILKYNDENSLSCVITLAYYSAKRYYDIIRELPSGRGFADLVFVPKPGVDTTNYPAMIIELKWKKEAETAIKQIQEQKYLKGLGSYQGEVLLVGISYEKAKKGESHKEHQCIIEKMQV